MGLKDKSIIGVIVLNAMTYNCSSEQNNISEEEYIAAAQYKIQQKYNTKTKPKPFKVEETNIPTFQYVDLKRVIFKKSDILDSNDTGYVSVIAGKDTSLSWIEGENPRCSRTVKKK